MTWYTRVGLITVFLVVPIATMAAGAVPPQVTDWVTATRKTIRLIDLQTLKTTLEQKAAVRLIDVREPDEFQTGHIQGAINIPRGVIEFRIWPLVGYPDRTDLATPIILYCGSGARCALAAQSLQNLGLTNVRSADMSLKDWVDAGLPLVK